MEIRLKDIKLDYDAEHRKLGGYINVVERESETLYSQQRNKWFKEVMKQGVFTRALQKNDAVPMLLEHDWDKQVAHTSDGTLELREDAIGLRFDAIVDEKSYEDIKNRNITSCSFGFKVNEQIFENVNPKLEKRYVTNIDLFEVSLVSNPAYIGSLCEQRNLEKALENMDKVEEIQEEVVTQETIKENEVVEETVEIKTEEETVEEVIETVETEEERNITAIVDVTDSQVKEDAKEVIQEVIEQKQDTAEFYETVSRDADDYKEIIKEDAQEQISNLEQESYHFATQAMKLRLEVLKLKQIQMNL